MQRCLNDLFYYCSGEPDPTEAPSYKVELDYQGLTHRVPFHVARCKKDPLTCSYCLTLSQSLALPKPLVIPIP